MSTFETQFEAPDNILCELRFNVTLIQPGPQLVKSYCEIPDHISPFFNQKTNFSKFKEDIYENIVCSGPCLKDFFKKYDSMICKRIQFSLFPGKKKKKIEKWRNIITEEIKKYVKEKFIPLFPWLNIHILSAGRYKHRWGQVKGEENDPKGRVGTDIRVIITNGYLQNESKHDVIYSYNINKKKRKQRTTTLLPIQNQGQMYYDYLLNEEHQYYSNQLEIFINNITNEFLVKKSVENIKNMNQDKISTISCAIVKNRFLMTEVYVDALELHPNKVEDMFQQLLGEAQAINLYAPSLQMMLKNQNSTSNNK